MLKNLKIRTRVVLSVVLTGLILFSVASFHFYFFSTRVLTALISENLNAVVTARSHHVDTFLEEQKIKNELIASSSIFKRILNTSSPDYDTDFKKASNRLTSIIEAQETINEIFILDNEGKIICSSNRGIIGSDKSNNDFFINGLNETYIKDVYYSELTKKNSIAILSPIICEGNRCPGVMVSIIETTVLDNIASDFSDLGETWEIYLVNQEGYMITPSRFEENTFLKQKIDTSNAKDCLSELENRGTATPEPHESRNKDDEIIEVFKNFRGINVLGASHVSHVMNWCTLSEVSESEAMAPMNNLLIIFIAIISIVLILFFITIYLLVRSISKPIIILRESTEKIKKGEFSHRINLGRKDEIGKLAESINLMSKELEESRDKIEKRVADRTKDLEDANKLMVGRELRMMELKKEITELKNKLKDKK